jgi:hypothetical protein
MALDAHTEDLLATARQTLLKELLPALPKSQHYTCLMAANAIAISLRVNQAGDAPLRARAKLLGELGEPLAEPTTEQVLAGERALADAFRRGAHDGHDVEVAERLRAQISARLQVTNPKLAARR